MTCDSIYGVQNFECAYDGDVIATATAVLQSKPEHQSIEIWSGARMVARVPRMQSDAAQ